MRDKLVLGVILLGLVAASSGTAFADSNPATAIITNGVLALGVSSDGELAQGGVGIQFEGTGAEGLATGCPCGASVSLGADAIPASVESFTFTGDAATSTVLVQDPASGSSVAVTQDFHPAQVASNLYEILVTVSNQGTAVVQPTYTRTVSWADGSVDAAATLTDPMLSVQPAPDGSGLQLQVSLPPIDPGTSQQFRLYYGAGSNAADASAGLQPVGASVISQENGGTSSFVFGYAPGSGAIAASSGGGIRSAGGAGGSGSAGTGGGGGGSGTGGGGGVAGGGAGGFAAGRAAAGVGPGKFGPSGTTNGGGSVAMRDSATNVNTATESTTNGNTTTDSTTSGDRSNADGNVSNHNLFAPSLLANDQRPMFEFPLATPEASSLALFATGAASLIGYAGRRYRAGRRK